MQINGHTIWTFTESNPPDDDQFREIQRLLLIELCSRFRIDFRILKSAIESRNWIHASIRGSLDDALNTVYQGVIVYSFRENKPVADVVLLPFSNGERLLLHSGESILTTHFDPSNGWDELKWEEDIYDEWNLDRLSESTLS